MKLLIYTLAGILWTALPIDAKTYEAGDLPTDEMDGKISEQERSFIMDFLSTTETKLLETLENIDDDQWLEKPSDSEWSVAECLEHIVLAEKALFGQVQQALAEPSGNDDLRKNDGWLLGKITDRGNKVNTPLPPHDGQIDKKQLINDFKKSRKDIGKFLKDESLGLRNHYGKSPYGKADVYQLFIVIAAHAQRHTTQIEEILSKISS